MQRKFIAILALALLLVMPLASTPRSNADPSTEIKVDPASTTAILNNDYVVYVKIKDVTDLYGWEFQLSYDHTVLHLTSDSIVSGGLNEPTQTYQQLTDDANGHLWWAVSTKYPTVTGINYTDHNIFEIHFHTIGTGTSVLTLNGTILSDSHGNEITATATSGSITVTGPNPDVAITSAIPKKTVIGQTYVGNFTVNVQNQGNDTETFNATLYANMTAVSVKTVTDLQIGDSSLIESSWDTTGFAYGNYTIKAAADTVPGETNTANNNWTCTVSVHVGVPGDVSSSTPGVYDKVTNMFDIAYLINLFQTKPTKPPWYPNADVNNDGVVDMKDIAIAIYYFNRHEA
jgi:hypothetical protein